VTGAEQPSSETMVRAYTEEIEAHRLTRERAEKAERQLAEEREWFAIARRGLDEKDARLAELVRRTREELEYWRDMRTVGNATHAGFDKLLKEFGDRYEGGEHG
jgi:hypothetical protein